MAAAYPGRDSHDYMMDEASRCPAWLNGITLRSLELARSYEPGAYVTRIAPTPLLMKVANDDAQTPSDMQQEAFKQADQAKRLMQLPGGHSGVCREHFDASSTAAAHWFAQNLL